MSRVICSFIVTTTTTTTPIICSFMRLLPILWLLKAAFDPYMPTVAEWLACWTQAQKGPGSNRSRDAVG